MMGSLFRKGRQIRFWPVAEGQGRDGRRIDDDNFQGELQHTQETRRDVKVTLSAVAEGRIR